MRVASEKTHHDKKHWNAAARDLSDSRWDYYAVSYCHWCHRDGSSGAGDRYFDSSRQVVNCLAVASALWRLANNDETHDYGAQHRGCRFEPSTYSAPTAAEISKTTMLSEMQIWIIARTFAQRASSGASVGPNVELCVNATNR
jgi:hypothetical protein